MLKSKHSRDASVVALLIFFVFTTAIKAEVSSEPAGDELLKMLPAESLFCVRVNNLDNSLGQIDQFLTGISPMPMFLSMTVRGQLAKMLGSQELTGLNMSGNFALFAVAKAGAPTEPKQSDMFVGVLAPVTDYKQFIDGNPNLSQPDANGVSTNIGSGFGWMLIKQVGNYALIAKAECSIFTATAKSLSAAEARGLAGILDADEVNRAVKEPIWAYGNVQLVSKVFGPLIFGEIEKMKKMMKNMESGPRTKFDPPELIECYSADTDSDQKITVDEIGQRVEELKTQLQITQQKIQAEIKQLEQQESQLTDSDSDRRNAIEEQIEDLKKSIDDSKQDTQARIDRLERVKSRLADMGPEQKVDIREELIKVQSGNRQPPKLFANVMNMYASFLETLMKETKSLSLTVRPEPNVCNMAMSISALPATDMANIFVADASSGQENKLLNYLENGTVMNFAGKMNTPFWKLYATCIDLMPIMMGEGMPAEEIAKLKALVENAVVALGDSAAGTFSVDIKYKPPFRGKYVVAVKDQEKFNQLIEEGSQMMNTGAIANLYKSMGLEMDYTIKRAVDDYKGISIDSAKLIMKSTEPNSPQGQMINAMYGEGFDSRWAVVDGLCVSVMSGDVDSDIRKLIDQVKAGGPKQLPDEMKTAMSLIPQAGKADFVGTYNFLRWFKVIGAMMPAPSPIPQMDISTSSNIAFAGKMANGKMTFEIALPKEHLMEMMGMFMKMQQQQMQKEGITSTSVAHLKGIGKACLIYANDYDGKFPPNLQELIEKCDLTPKHLESPLKPQGFGGPSYIYVEGQNAEMDPGNILVYENPAFCTDRINVLFLDAHTAMMKQAEFLQELQATYKRLGRDMPEVKFKVPSEAIKK